MEESTTKPPPTALPSTNFFHNTVSFAPPCSLTSAQNRIRTSPFSGQTGTALSAAIRDARLNQFSSEGGDRVGVQNVLLLMVNSVTDMNAVMDEVELAKAAGITIIAVSITGRVTENQIFSMASPPWGNSKKYHEGRLDVKNDPNLDPKRKTRLDPKDDFDVECVAAAVCHASSRSKCDMKVRRSGEFEGEE